MINRLRVSIKARPFICASYNPFEVLQIVTQGLKELHSDKTMWTVDTAQVSRDRSRLRDILQSFPDLDRDWELESCSAYYMCNSFANQRLILADKAEEE